MTKRRIFYSTETRSKIRIRAASVILLIASGFALLVYRCLTLHVSPDPRLQRLATNQYKARLQVARPRGSIYDNHGDEMAVSVPTYSLAVRPAKLAAPKQLAINLSDALSLSRQEIFSKLSSDKKYVWIKRHLSPKEVDLLKSDEEEPGVEWVNESKRYYPNRELASQILGVVGTDGQGLGGLEQTYERFLDRHGKDSDAYQDARGRRLELPEQIKEEPSGPLDIWLTLNKSIQFTVETELEQVCRQYHAKSCTGIVMDPQSGDVLAMATYPSFNPNLRNKSDLDAWKNRAITDGFEPGSTFKVIMAAAALEAGVVRPEDRFFCENGLYPVGSHVIHDSHPHGLLSFREIVKVSSNIGMVKIGQRVGKAEFDRTMRAFGFGQKTGIDFPGEDSGTIRPASSWGEIEFANMSFGQGVRVTPLQVLRAYSIIASGGYDVKPHFVSKVETPEGGEIWRFQNSPKRVLKSSTTETLTRMLMEATEEGGTGTQAKLSAYRVAGKTGTAQKVKNGRYSKQDFVASFVGFAPAGNPRVAALVAVDEPRGQTYGGVVAAPVFRKIVWESLRELGVAPEIPNLPLSLPTVVTAETSFSGVSGGGLSRRSGSAGLRRGGMGAIGGAGEAPDGVPIIIDGVPDFRGLSIREVLRLVEERKIPAEIEGSGIVQFQRPAPGTKLAQGESCRIVLKNIQ